MKLLKRQRNWIFDLILSRDLDPSSFQLEEFPSSDLMQILYVDNSYAFECRLGGNRIGESEFICDYSPGLHHFNVRGFNSTWEGVQHDIAEWLSSLKEEIGTTDKWEQFENGIVTFNLRYENLENDKFSAAEHNQLRQQVHELKQRLAKISQLEDGLPELNRKLDHLTDLALEMGRSDWRDMFVGAFVSHVMSYALSPDIVALIVADIKATFGTLMLLITQ